MTNLIQLKKMHYVLFLAVPLVCAHVQAAAVKRPNIVLFLSDDHGVDFVGCYGNKVVRTPNMDALAGEGLRFTRAFAGSPTCSPSRAILFTGLHSARNGTMGNHTNCRPDIKSLPTYLKALGYRVVAANKTDVRPKAVFDWEVLPATLPKRPEHNRRYRGEGLDTAKIDEFLASHAKERPDEPLCLLLGDNCPHVVWEPNRDYDPTSLPIPPFMVDTPKTRVALAGYYQDITTCDRHVGEVRASLKKHGMEQNTVFIYTSDQGSEWPHCKWTCYDTGLRVPLIVRWPGVVKGGATTDAMISLADFTPTLVDLAGGEPAAGMDGRSFKGVLTGKSDRANEFIFASHTDDGTMNIFPQRCIRDARWKLIFNLAPENKWTTHFTKVMDVPNSHGEVYSTWLERARTDAVTAKLVETLERHPRWELYDTQTDPYELRNLAGNPEQAERIAALRMKLHEWLRLQCDEKALAVLGGQSAATERIFDLRGQWDQSTPLKNPHKGWYHHYPDNHIDKYKVARDSDLLEFPGMDHIYIRLAWAYLEPREGQFDWPVIDRIIEKWSGHGLGIAFRISCKETSTDRLEQQYATPRWVMEAGAKGGHYKAGKPTGPEGPWEPRFDDPIFLAKLENFLKAFAARYDGKPWLRYVDVGSIGDWGEGHTGAGSRMECGPAARRRHIDLHAQHFKRSQLIISDDFVYALTDPAQRKDLHQHVIKSGIGYRDDSILVNGYLSGASDRFTVRSPEFFADTYLKNFSVLELEHYGMIKKQGNWEALPDSAAAKFGKGKKGPDYFRGALELLHATYIGYHGYAHEWLADNPRLTGELLNRCGYWYFPHRASLPETLRPGQEAMLEIAWENRGVAPAHHPYQLHVRLAGASVVEREFDAGNQRWLPGAAEPFVECYRLSLPADLKAGEYALKIKLRSKAAGRDVLLAMKSALMDKEGYYEIGKVHRR